MIDVKKINRIYFVAICGTAMASLAALLKSRGYTVYGSDRDVYPPMSTFLQDQDIPVFQGFDPAHLEPKPDLVVIGNAMSRGNVEVEAILEQKLHYVSLPEVLKEFFIRGRRSIVVTGTHGKTTTTAMLSWVFTTSGRDPGFLLGGIAQNFGSGFRDGKGPEFIIEGDEYDTAFFDKGPKFLHYLPEVLIVNNIEFDHADIYDSIDQIKLNFRRLVNLVPRNGLFLAGAEDKNVQELIARAFCPVQTFGLAPECEWRAENIVPNAMGLNFTVIRKDQALGDIFIPMFGLHNVRNTLAAVAASSHVGIKFDQIRKSFLSFQSVRRRMELRGVVNEIYVYDDFAHHPTEVRATLNAGRHKHPTAKIWAVFEPRTATTRRKVFQTELANAFADADEVLVTPVHRPDKTTPDNLFSVEQMIADLNAKDIRAATMPNVDVIVDYIAAQVQPGDVILALSNGSFDNIHEKLLTRLKKMYSTR